MAETPLAPAAPSPEDAEILRDLRDLCADALRDLTLKVGAYVFRTFFDSSEEEFSSHAPTKGDRFSAFVARTGDYLSALGLSERALLYNTRVFIVFRQMPPPVQGALDPSHYVELYRLPAPVDRTKLALRAADERWSVRMLRAEVDAWRAQNLKARKPPGRQRLPDAVKAWSGAARLVGALVLDQTSAAALTPKERKQVLGLLAQVEKQARDARRILRAG